MRKIIVAVTVGLLLVAGQAAAANTAVARVGDRVGARAGASSEQAPVAGGLFGLGAGGLVVGGVIIATAISIGVIASNDETESEA